MASCFLGELHAGAQAEFGVDVGEVGLHGARRDEKPCGDVIVGQPFADESDDVALSRGQRCPAAGGSFALAAAALRIGDRLLGGQGRALDPRAFKVLRADGISECRQRGFVTGVIDLEPRGADALPDSLCCAKEAGGFAVTAVLAGQNGEALEGVGDEQVSLNFGGAP